MLSHQCGMVTTMTTMMVPTSPAYQRNSFVPPSFPKPKPSSTSPFVSPTVCLSPGFDQLPEIAHNKVLIAAGISAAIGQLSKPFTSSLLYSRKFDLGSAIQPGGFPSTHSSAVVAAATSLALERGFSDSIFGMAVVFASLVMYDAQGVRREVGNHAKTINMTLSKTRFHCNDGDDMSTTQPGKPSSNIETSPAPKRTNATLLARSPNRLRQTSSTLMSSGLDTDAEEGSKKVINPLKETVGHTEVEVLAGALLGFFVSLAVQTML